MKSLAGVLCGLLVSWTALAATSDAAAPAYPPAQRADTVDDYFGTRVPAPYQWMEDLSSPAVGQWVDAENKLTFSYLDRVPERDWVHQRLKQLWNYARMGVPDEEAGRLFFSKNSGLQNQSVVFEQDGPEAAPHEIVDPNTLSPDGSVALLGFVASPDAHYLLYALSQGGSDWENLHVRDLNTGTDLGDSIEQVKFSNLSWTKDGKGFFYSRYPKPPAGEAISTQVRDQALYYHLLGRPQSADKLIYARPDLPEWLVEGSVSEDGRYLFISLENGTSPNNELYYADLADPIHPDVGAAVKPLFTGNDAAYEAIGNLGDTVYIRTTLKAPRGEIAAFNLSAPDAGHWRSVVPEGANVISAATMSNHDVVVNYLVDVRSEVHTYDSDGRQLGTLPLPDIGSVMGLSGRNDSPQLYYSFTSYLYPTTVYRYDMGAGKGAVFFKPDLTFDPTRYESREVFYTSKDGTRVPMIITAKKGLKLDGKNPTLLYAYGGFDISITPSFSARVPVWLELGGVYAVANLRGGGEYGEQWHEAGMLQHKQNVFDDFVWAAKYLIKENYASPKTLGIWGYSNGGLLIGATITQHPELFGAAYAGAGVMDMLRYQRFSGGALWAPEYGSSDDPKAFPWLRAYSPLQNLKPGVCLPPTIVTTADHDDRVVPSHSYKFTAAAQHDQACANPVLIRVETKTSHNYMPTDKQIAQWADVWTFLAYNLGIQAPPN